MMSSLITYAKEITRVVKKNIFSDSFIRNVLKLMTGTTIAQAISIIVSPILRRIYTPEEFGILALYLSFASFLSVFVNGRYNIAITLPQNKKDALSIVLLCFYIAFIVSIISLLIVLFCNHNIAIFLNNHTLAIWLYFIPLKILIIGFSQTLNYWFVRMGYYAQLSISKVIQSLGITVLNISIGLAGFGVEGLIFGILIGEFIGVLFLGIKFCQEDGQNLIKVEWKDVKIQLMRYKNFPLYSLPADLINAVTNEMPNLLLSKFFGASAVGLLSLTQRTVAMPSGLIASSVLDVFKESASTEYRTNGNCRSIYLKTFKSLIIMAIIPFTILLLFAPQIFSFVFGETWKESGSYAQILAPFFFLGFIVSPLSYIFYITEKQIEDLLVHLYVGLSTIIVLLGGFSLFHDIKYCLIAYSINYSIIYLYYLSRSYHFSRGVKE